MNTLTPECRAFLLEQARTGKLATVRADGRPHVVPIWFDLDGDSIIFSTWHTAVKTRNIQHDARVSLCVDDEKPPYRFALIEGTATITSDLDLLKHWTRHLAGRYLGAHLAEAYGARNGVEGEVIVRITPTKVLFQENIAG